MTILKVILYFLYLARKVLGSGQELGPKKICGLNFATDFLYFSFPIWENTK